jgi:hypothetical protein
MPLLMLWIELANMVAVEEPGLSVSSAAPGELRDLIRAGEFFEQTHLSVLAIALATGVLRGPRLQDIEG